MPLLPVSHRQQRQQADCLATCAAIVLDYLQVPNDYDRLCQLLKVRHIGATFHNLKQLERLGVTVLVDKGEETDLRTSVELGLPPIVFVKTAELPYWDEALGHAVVVVGFEDNTIYLNDPAFPDAPKQAPVDEFLLAWIDADQFYALIRLQ